MRMSMSTMGAETHLPTMRAHHICSEWASSSYPVLLRLLRFAFVFPLRSVPIPTLASDHWAYPQE